jgi:hypothetical protein
VREAVYLDMLKNCAVPQLLDGYIFQQDGAPPHSWTHVTEFLNEQLTRMWISQDGPISQSPLLPDFTPLDYFLWQYNQTKVNDLPDLHCRITDGVAPVTLEILRNIVTQNIE